MQDTVTVEFDTIGDLLIDDTMLTEFDCTPKNFDEYYLDKYKGINKFLSTAENEQMNAVAVTNVMHIDGHIAGFYSISMGVATVSKRYRKNTPNFHGEERSNIGYPSIDVPYLAIDSKFQGRGLGRILLKHLLLNVYWQIRPVVGGCFITLDALNPAVDFYSKFGFKEYSQGRQEKRTKAMACLSFDIDTILSLNDGVPDPEVAEEINSISDTLPIFAWEKPTKIVVK